MPPRVDVAGLPVGVIVTVSNGPKPRPADRTIAELARDGIYRTAEHLAVARANHRPGRDPEGFVEAHVRRLEALRRAGIVERLDEGVWTVPPDLADRGELMTRAARVASGWKFDPTFRSTGKCARSAPPGWIVCWWSNAMTSRRRASVPRCVRRSRIGRIPSSRRLGRAPRTADCSRKKSSRDFESTRT